MDSFYVLISKVIVDEFSKIIVALSYNKQIRLCINSDGLKIYFKYCSSKYSISVLLMSRFSLSHYFLPKVDRIIAYQVKQKLCWTFPAASSPNWKRPPATERLPPLWFSMTTVCRTSPTLTAMGSCSG